MSTHTPGPWSWHGHKDAPHLFDLKGGNGNVLYRVVMSPEVDGAEGDDDLVAAAPDLLEKLEELLRDVVLAAGHGGPASVFWQSVSDARAAIAKARGES